MMPGYWGTGYFSTKYWADHYWFENMTAVGPAIKYIRTKLRVLIFKTRERI